MKTTKTKNYKTTVKDFNYFIQEVCHWLPKLNLQDHGMVFLHMELEKNTALTWVEVSLENKTATFGLSEDWSWLKPDKYELSKCAFHECCELMLYKLHHSLTEFYSYKHVNEMRHEVVRTLESALFEPYWHSKSKKGKK
uniref:Uncharacterized protein n=1 Tax=viral metagenome TaxID=1070528 RepID=A0A6M3LGV7_9ZZZZ